MTVAFGPEYLWFDLETHSVTERYGMSPREYFRLGGYSWGDSDEVTITEDYDEMVDIIRSAGVVVAHNGHAFDLSVLFGRDSDEPLQMSRDQRVLDTFIHATLANPAPEGLYTGRKGPRRCKNVGEYRKWYSLDNQAFQLGVEGKSTDLSELADEYGTYRPQMVGPDGEPAVYKSGPRKGEPKLATTRKPIEGVCCGYGAIPLDLPEFRSYLEQDVRCLREVARGLIERHPMNHYAWREQVKAGIDAQISRNGFRLDHEAANDRVQSMAEAYAHNLNDLHERFGLPLHGKKPLASKEGKAALLLALKSVGVKEMDLERTPTGAPSFGGDSIRKACGWTEVDGVWVRDEDARSDALELAELVATLAGQRSLPELALASVHPDGWVHPSIWPGQRSGRKSTTEPGLTVWDDSHKDYWLADNDDEVLIEIDASNADARCVAAESGDRNFAIRFQPGQDGHMLNAAAVWGAERAEAEREVLRPRAKAGGHAWGYRVQPAKLSKTLGISFPEAKKFLDGLNRAYPEVVRWQEAMSKQGADHGFVMNDWGRRMVITGSTFTQPPALVGQSSTNEIIADGLINLPNRYVRMIKITNHDAVLLSMPRATLDRDLAFVLRCFTRSWKPEGHGQKIEFPFGHGPPGRTWKECAH